MRPLTAAIAAVAALAAFAFCPEYARAQTGDSKTITVTARVKATCRFSSTPNINFGEIDPSTAADVTQAVSISFSCTKGVRYFLLLDRGQNEQGGRNRMRSREGNDFIPYEIEPRIYSGTGTGFDSASTVKVEGSIRGQDYRNVRVGPYSDTVTVRIRP